MTFDNEHMLRDFARLLREARPIPAHTAVTVLDEAAAELADLRAENARLNAMRQHCERCGGDYLATGVETGCPCALRARVAEQDRLLDYVAPKQCPIGIPPEHSRICSAGYCRKCAEDRLNTSAEASHTHVPDQFLPFRVEEQTGSYPHQNEWEVWTAGDDDTSFQVAVCNSKLMAEAIAHYGRELMQRAHPRQESVR